MRELRFDGLSPDGSRLILAGKDGQKWSVVIDERIEAAVRRDRARIGQVEIEQAGMLRPREIQARIRSGQTAEDVAAASGLPIEHIRRFEGPVLTERAWVAQQAQSTEVRRPGGDIELGDLVAERLHAEGVEPADIRWDAWRRDDGTWVVIATFPLPPNTHVASWTYDSSSRTMTVVDDNARSLSAIDPDAPLHLAASRPMLSVAPIEDEEDDAEPAVITSLPAWAHRGDQADEPDFVDELDHEDRDEPEPAEATADEFAEDVADEAVADRADEAADGPVDDELDELDDEAVDDLPDSADDESGESGVAEGEAGSQEGPQDAGPTSDAEDVPLFETPAPPAHRPTGKPSVPSFDDILFGPGPGK